MTARSPKHLAQLRRISHALVSTLQKHRSKLIRFGTGSQHFRDSWVTTYSGSCVANLLKQEVVSQKSIFLLPWHYTTIYLVIDSLTIFIAQILHSHMYWGKYVYTLLQIETYTARKNFSQGNVTQSNLNRTTWLKFFDGSFTTVTPRGRVADSEVFGWSRGRFFCPTPTGSPIGSFLESHCWVGHSCWNDTISFEAFVDAENSCCVSRFPLIASCYKIIDSQINFIHFMLRSRKYWKGRSWSRTFYLRLPNSASRSRLCPIPWSSGRQRFVWSKTDTLTTTNFD